MIRVRKLKTKTVALLLEYVDLQAKQPALPRPQKPLSFDLTKEQIGQVFGQDGRFRPDDLKDSLGQADFNIHFSEEQKDQVSEILKRSVRFEEFNSYFNQYKPKPAAIITSRSFAIGVDIFAISLAIAESMYHLATLTVLAAGTFVSAAASVAIVFGAIFHYAEKRKRDKLVNALVHQFIGNQLWTLKCNQEKAEFAQALTEILELLKELHYKKYPDAAQAHLFSSRIEAITANSSSQAQYKAVVNLINDCHGKQVLNESQYRVLQSLLPGMQGEIEQIQSVASKESFKQRIKKRFAPRLQGGAPTALTFVGIAGGIFGAFLTVVNLVPAAAAVAAMGPLVPGALALLVSAGFIYWVYKNNQQKRFIKEKTRLVKSDNMGLMHEVLALRAQTKSLVKANGRLREFLGEHAQMEDAAMKSFPRAEPASRLKLSSRHFLASVPVAAAPPPADPRHALAV